MAKTRLSGIRAGTRLHRIHRQGHNPIHFGPDGKSPVHRYDDPEGRFKLLYLARSLATAFAETLIRLPEVGYVLSTDVLVRARSELVTTRPLRLYPLIDGRVSAHGLSFTDLHGAAYAKTWAISAEIHQTTAADGILYTSRFNNQRCVALFDRAANAIEETEVRAEPLTPELATEIAATFGKDYVEP